MARGLKRLVGLVALACAAVAVALLPPREPAMRGVQRGVGDAEDAARRARQEAAEGGEALRLLDLTDSLGHAAAAHPSTDSLVWLIDDRLPTQSIAEITEIYRSAWERLGSWDTTVTMTVFVLIDSVGTSYQGYPRRKSGEPALWKTPGIDDVPTCIVGLNLDHWDTEAVASGGRSMGWVLARTRDYRLGPCAYYAAFGMPGERVREWIERWGLAPVIYANWDVPLWTRRRLVEAQAAWYLRSRSTIRPSSQLPFDLLACAHGDRDRCRAAIQPHFVDVYRGGSGIVQSWLPGLIEGRWRRSYDYYYYRSSGLGPRVGHYFSDMVTEFGRERFARFWRSNAPLEDAFEQAMGVPLDEWTMQWVQSTIGVPETPADIPAGSVLASLIVMGVLLGGASLFAFRRQVV